MGRFAERIHTDRADIDRLEAHLLELPNDARVALRLDDGSELVGTVAARASLQLFEDRDGNEGMNAILRLEDVTLDGSSHADVHDLWLDRIVDVRRMPGQSAR
ncbi:DUF3247 family protein [Marilutibacter aestuarii]|uniref:DUF3247 family protein n=1 Tax=Marilutibacter aestuarii TaxID=1706195 RepID=A0A508AN59_9GAMM|nr:DUF3247 family protein [Lysobacter aestuarii]TQD50917.1 DUF3247 family protein [Lysobacter aestuarii]